ncbi:hypothetical protein MMC20_002814 [Loxospora ochrophaea]|nr:hypothetical protein [Loxospora ochrophaea]
MLFKHRPMRYIKNKPKTLLRESDPKAHIVQSLSKVVREYAPKEDTANEVHHGLFSGPMSVAYIFFQLSQSHPDLLIDGESPGYWCNAYLNSQRAVGGVKAKNCGIINEELAFCAVAAAVSKDINYVHRLLESLPNVLTNDGSDEWLFGRAGTLYLLRLVKRWVPESAELVDKHIKTIISCILANGPPWRWHGKQYLGAAHGAVGIITQIVLSDSTYAPTLEPRLSGLLDQQMESGNWKSSASGRDLVQFCHGAPGFVISLVAIRQHFPTLQPRIDVAIERARQRIWEKGLLRKEPCLCHGTSGNAMALLSSQREHFMTHTTAAVIEKAKRKSVYKNSDDLYGLYGGEAGRAWGWIVLERGGEEGMIGYSDL